MVIDKDKEKREKKKELLKALLGFLILGFAVYGLYSLIRLFV